MKLGDLNREKNNNKIDLQHVFALPRKTQKAFMIGLPAKTC